MGDAASVSIKNLLGLASVIIVSGILVGGMTGLMGSVNKASKINWIDNNLKPAVMDQCASCRIGCGGGEDPNPKDGTFSQRFDAHEMYLEWKGDSNNRLHLIMEDENGEKIHEARIAVSKNLALFPDRGCKKPDDSSQLSRPDDGQAVILKGDTSSPGIKNFKVYHNGPDDGSYNNQYDNDWEDVQSQGRGAIIVVS